MQFTNIRNLLAKTALLWIVIIISCLPVLVSCGDDPESADKSALPAGPESFTFFDLGKATRLTDDVRSDLSSRLGRDAIAGRSILDLEINYRGFIKKYFPELAALNQQLNFPTGERVEHNTIKLMYRYSQKKDVPFELVELIFSDYTRTPILFKIAFKTDEANTIQTLQEKYGQPEEIYWNEDGGKSMFWKKTGDVLIVSRIPDRFGKIEYQIVIYFVDNLKKLIDTERKEKEEKEQQRLKTGQKAF